MDEIEVIRKRCKTSTIVGILITLIIVFSVAVICVNSLETRRMKIYEATLEYEKAREISAFYEGKLDILKGTYSPNKSYTSENKAPKEYEKAEKLHNIKVVLAITGGLVIAFFCFATFGVEIVVTNMRVYGKAMFNKRVDLPLDSISSVYISGFSTVAVSSSSGRILFSFINDSDKIHNEVCTLLLDRQKRKECDSLNPPKEVIMTSTADEIKKYKELLVQGIITNEEFEEKKKILLNI